ncbi:MAG: DUF6273 domain-containing protein, partial [Phocaeicola sp.]
MSDADTLLDALILDPENEGHITIDSDRRITVPDKLKRIAVQYDHNIETVTFDCPRYWDGIDLSSMRVYVNYMRADNKYGSYLCDNVVVDETDTNIFHFDWTISRHASAVKGALSILVCINEVDDEGAETHHWNSELNTDMYVSTGLEVTSTIINTHADIITHLLNRMDEIESYETVITAEHLVELQNQITTNKNLHDQDVLALQQADTQMQTDISNLQNFQSEQTTKNQSFEDADTLLGARIDELETTLTGAVTAISHSLTNKGVTVPDDMSIQDVSALIDTIVTDVPTELQSISITTPPNKTEYGSIDDPVDTTGMVVTADFGDGNTVDVTGYDTQLTLVDEASGYILVSLTVNGVRKEATYPITLNTKNTVADMVLGDDFYIYEEGDVTALYKVVDTDYYGNVLVVRNNCVESKLVTYYNTAPTSAYLTKYEGSSLDTYLNTTYYASLPSSTTNVIQSVDIPIRENASSSAGQAYLNRNIFTLSAKEWGLNGSSYEGEAIEYTDIRAEGNKYWTRENVGGMTSYAY